MAVNPMQRKSRNMFLLGMLIMLLIGGGVAGFLIYQITQLNEVIAAKEVKTACLLKQDVQSGAILDESMIEVVKLPKAPSDALTKTDIKENTLKTKTALKKGVALSADMVNPEGAETRKDTRTVEYNMLTLPSKLENGNYIDIRFTLASGQDYIVVSKKQVKNCDSTTIWVDMTEDEILTMNNAIVEFYIMPGSNLYATVYSEAGLQEPATPTYGISVEVSETLRQSPNLLQDAIVAFNSRAESVTVNRQSINRALSAYSQDRLANIEEKVQDTIERTLESRIKYIGQLDASAINKTKSTTK